MKWGVRLLHQLILRAHSDKKNSHLQRWFLGFLETSQLQCLNEAHPKRSYSITNQQLSSLQLCSDESSPQLMKANLV